MRILSTPIFTDKILIRRRFHRPVWVCRTAERNRARVDLSHRRAPDLLTGSGLLAAKPQERLRNLMGGKIAATVTQNSGWQKIAATITRPEGFYRYKNRKRRQIENSTVGDFKVLPINPGLQSFDCRFIGDRQFFTPFRTACSEHFSSVGGRHTLAEAVFVDAFPARRLESSFHCHMLYFLQILGVQR